jgi:hypothetical protein
VNPDFSRQFLLRQLKLFPTHPQGEAESLPDVGLFSLTSHFANGNFA